MEDHGDRKETPLTVEDDENDATLFFGYFILGPLLMVTIGLIIAAVKWIAA